MRFNLAAAVAALMLAAAPQGVSAQAASPSGADVAALPGGLSLRALAMMDRVSDPRVSPDGRRVLYGVRSTDWDGDRGVSALWVAELNGAEPRKLDISTGGASTGRWAADGQAIYFLSSRGGSNQVWRADAQGQAAVQVTSLPVDVVAFRVSPDGRGLILALPVFIDCDTLQCTKDRIGADARSPSTVTGYDRMPLRQFDHWNDGRRQHLFVQPLNGSGLAEGQPRDLMAGLDADTPSQPQGGEGEFAVSPDGRTVVYATETQGAREAFTDNSDLFRVSIDGGAAVNLTAANSAPDGSPAFSPDGRRLAWLAGERENVGGDQARIMVADADGSNPRALAPNWDRGPGSLTWTSDGRALLVTAADDGQNRLFSIDARTGAVAPLTGRGTISGVESRAGVLVYAREGFDGPAQIMTGVHETARAVTDHNAETLAGLNLPDAQAFTFAGWNGEPVRGWVFKPVGYVEGRAYPAVYLIHGGPKSPWLESWSYRWNPQIYTSAGYAVVMINFHGSPGYGQAFTDSINDHWGDRPLEDLQKGWAAALAENRFIDGGRACALGGSYGGYMVNLIAGKWNGPWACLVNHAGVFDVPQLMNATDISNFISEFGGPSWERMDLYRAFSPGDYAGNWTKPMLVLHGSRDFRVPMEQGLATFSALQRRGVPSRFVHVPDENHWVLKPRNWVDWQNEILTWTARWTAPPP
jgi:acylaminoacyl-peptidase